MGEQDVRTTASRERRAFMQALLDDLRSSWLSYSARIRRSGLHDLLPSLPGLHPDPAGAPGSLRVKAGAPEMVREVLRLFGYRKGRVIEGGQRFLLRRQER